MNNKGHFAGVAFGELRPMPMAFGMLALACTLILFKVVVQVTAIGGDRPWFGYGSASVAIEAQSASIEVHIGDAHLVKERDDVRVAPIIAAPWPFDGDLAT